MIETADYVRWLCALCFSLVLGFGTSAPWTTFRFISQTISIGFVCVATCAALYFPHHARIVKAEYLPMIIGWVVGLYIAYLYHRRTGTFRQHCL